MTKSNLLPLCSLHFVCLLALLVSIFSIEHYHGKRNVCITMMCVCVFSVARLNVHWCDDTHSGLDVLFSHCVVRKCDCYTRLIELYWNLYDWAIFEVRTFDVHCFVPTSWRKNWRCLIYYCQNVKWGSHRQQISHTALSILCRNYICAQHNAKKALRIHCV